VCSDTVVVLASLYLAFTNCSNNLIKPLTIKASIDKTKGLNYRQFIYDDKESEIDFSTMPIQPGQTVVFPISTIIGPFEGWNFCEDSVVDEKIINDNDQAQLCSHIVHSSTTVKLNLIGPSIVPISLKYMMKGNNYIQYFEPINLTNFYLINRHWFSGCCPHVFFVNKENRIQYTREIFSHRPYLEMKEQIIVPVDIKHVIIAELEYEATFINRIDINSKSVVFNRILNKNQSLSLKVNEGDVIDIIGYYFPFKDGDLLTIPPSAKNNIINSYIKNNFRGDSP